MKASSLRLRRLTLSAVFVALTAVLLYIGAVIDVMDLSLVAMGALLVAFSELEMGTKYSLMIYGASGLLSFLVLPYKLPAVLYTVVAGAYPILKVRFERLVLPLCWACKLVWFNAVLSLAVWLMDFVLRLPDTGFSFAVSVYLLGNVTYILFDLALSSLIRAYRLTWRRRLRIGRFFGN